MSRTQFADGPKKGQGKSGLQLLLYYYIRPGKIVRGFCESALPSLFHPRLERLAARSQGESDCLTVGLYSASPIQRFDFVLCEQPFERALHLHCLHRAALSTGVIFCVVLRYGSNPLTISPINSLTHTLHIHSINNHNAIPFPTHDRQHHQGLPMEMPRPGRSVLLKLR